MCVTLGLPGSPSQKAFPHNRETSIEHPSRGSTASHPLSRKKHLHPFPALIMILAVLSVLLLFGYSSAYVNPSRRCQPLFRPLNVASFDLTPRIKSSSGKLVTQIDLLYDSECPLCAMEVEFLKKRDYENKIRFTDLSSLDYNPSDHGNVKFSDGMRKIRAILPDTNEVVTGVEVFRHVYR